MQQYVSLTSRSSPSFSTSTSAVESIVNRLLVQAQRTAQDPQLDLDKTNADAALVTNFEAAQLALKATWDAAILVEASDFLAWNAL